MDYERYYKALCYEQLEAAEEDYAELFEQGFCSRIGDPLWADPERGKAWLESLLSELYQDRLDFYDFCDMCGVPRDLLTSLGF